MAGVSDFVPCLCLLQEAGKYLSYMCYRSIFSVCSTHFLLWRALPIAPSQKYTELTCAPDRFLPPVACKHLQYTSYGPFFPPIARNLPLKGVPDFCPMLILVQVARKYLFYTCNGPTFYAYSTNFLKYIRTWLVLRTYFCHPEHTYPTRLVGPIFHPLHAICPWQAYLTCVICIFLLLTVTLTIPVVDIVRSKIFCL